MAASALSLLALNSHALALNVVQMSISKDNPQIDVLRQDLNILTRGAPISQELINNITAGAYLATVKVGTPAQTISLVLDTGSSDIFLLANTADQCTQPNIADMYGPCIGGTCKQSS